MLANAGVAPVTGTRNERASSLFRQSSHAYPEIDCIRSTLPPSVCAEAEQRAETIGVGANEALIAAGAISEEDYLRALASSLGLRFGNLDAVPRERCPVSDEMLLSATQVGMLPLRLGFGIVWVVAPRGVIVRRLIRMIGVDPALRRRILIATPQQIAQFVRRNCDDALGRRATETLQQASPLLSAATRSWRPRAGLAVAAAVIIGALTLAPGMTVVALQVAISTVFLAWSALRIASALLPEPQLPLIPPLNDDELPVYTIVAALYREADTVPDLLHALADLSYPREKLDIKIVVEADDAATHAALIAHGGALPLDIIVAPQGGPRTKPKALNAALPFARGEMLVVFDAEDRPERDQLRFAAERFAADTDGRLACVQARLAIDNTRDNWLTAIFTAEYAGLFDVLLPRLAHWRLPVPLGGSSNHFRTALLRKVGAWDPYNVTEDADLGIRLSRLGYQVAVVASTTDEEAPATLKLWLPQRTRWFKGWLQTWCVHMREPLHAARQMGLGGFVILQLTIIGSVLAAVLQPLALALILADAIFDFQSALGGPNLKWFHITALTSGYAASVLVAFVGLRRRRLLWVAWRLPMLIPHWALLSVAAWRALFQLRRDPHGWEKTGHGLARTSRRDASRNRSRPL